jgi:nucleoside-diphosphate-sugar epimerase
MRVVVTGASGNVGTSLLEQLAGEDSVEAVVGAARRRPDVELPKVEWVTADVAHDPLDDLLRGADTVVHLAWLFQPTHRPEVTWQSNVVGTQRLLEAAARAEVGKVVLASSVAAYSPRHDDEPVDESWPTHGGGPASYAREKAYVERLLDDFESHNPATAVVRMRPAFIFKESSATQQRRLFGGPLVPGSLVRKRLIAAVPWPTGLRFQALHSSDAGAAYRLAVLQDVRGAFNLAADPVLDALRVGELLEARTFPVPARLVRSGLSLAWGAHLLPATPQLFDAVMQLPLLDTTRARTELGWTPLRSSVEALETLLAGLRHGADGATPPLSKDSSGPLRSHEASTGVGDQP